jgi:hypothetical protein
MVSDSIQQTIAAGKHRDRERQQHSLLSTICRRSLCKCSNLSHYDHVHILA